MIVVDASAFVAGLVDTDPGGDAARAVLTRDSHWAVPQHFTLEAAHALRGLWLKRALDDDQFDACIARLRDGRFDIWPTVELLPRIRQLAANATAYDAAYIALAEDTGSVLLASDRKFDRIPGIRCRVVVAE